MKVEGGWWWWWWVRWNGREQTDGLTGWLAGWLHENPKYATFNDQSKTPARLTKQRLKYADRQTKQYK